MKNEGRKIAVVIACVLAIALPSRLAAQRQSRDLGEGDLQRLLQDKDVQKLLEKKGYLQQANPGDFKGKGWGQVVVLEPSEWLRGTTVPLPGSYPLDGMPMDPTVPSASPTPVSPKTGKPVPTSADLDQIQDCQDAINEFGGAVPNMIGANANEREQLVGFVMGCLTKQEATEDVQIDILKRSLVVFSTTATSLPGALTVAYCTGLLLDDKRVLTARHCFINEDTGEVRLPGKDALGATWGGGRSVAISATEISKLSTVGAFRVAQDQVVIPVKLSAGPSLPKVIRIEPKLNQALWLAGPISEYANYKAEIEGKAFDLRDGIFWSQRLAGQCIVTATDGRCVAHNCQTLPSFSGAPMIGYASRVDARDVIAIVGTHSGFVGSDGEPSACSGDPTGFQSTNIGFSGAMP